MAAAECGLPPRKKWGTLKMFARPGVGSSLGLAAAEVCEKTLN